MKLVFINLASQTERRASVERGFRLQGETDWTLERFDAIDAAGVEAAGIAGHLSPGQKGCFLSHRQVVEREVSQPGPLFVAEDDIEFSGQTTRLLDALLPQIGEPWDLLFTDLAIPSLQSMAHLLRRRRALSQSRSLEVVDCSTLGWAGATAYVVHEKAKAKLSALLNQIQSLDVPYDLVLRHCCAAGHLRAKFVFPFLTTVAPGADLSTIWRRKMDLAPLIWNTFRRMVWLEAKPEDYSEALRVLRESTRGELCDEFSILAAATASEDFVPS